MRIGPNAGDTTSGETDTQADVDVYTLSGCWHCERARQILHSNGIVFTEIRGDTTPGFRAKVAELTDNWTLPQITVDGEPVGGARELARLDRCGALLPLVRNEEFPVAVVRRRLSPLATLTAALTVLGGGSCGPWRYDVELIDRDGSVVDRQRAASRDEATELAAVLNAAP